jgi:hypothetical protein
LNKINVIFICDYVRDHGQWSSLRLEIGTETPAMLLLLPAILLLRVASFSSLLPFYLCLSVLEFLLFQFYEGRYTHEMAHNLGFTAGGWDVVTLRLQGGSWVTRGYSFRELVSWMGM